MNKKKKNNKKLFRNIKDLKWIDFHKSGIFFAAHAADKTVRAWLRCAEPRITAETCAQVLKARHHQTGEPRPTGTGREKPTVGLFD